jgi:hypothetical protein
MEPMRLNHRMPPAAPRSRVRLAASTLVLLGLVPGCGGSTSVDSPNIDGVLLVDQSPIDGTQLELFLASGDAPAAKEPIATTMTRSDGTFAWLPCDPEGPWPPTSSCRVTIEYHGAASMQFAEAYRDPNLTPLQVSFSTGSLQTLEIPGDAVEPIE